MQWGASRARRWRAPVALVVFTLLAGAAVSISSPDADAVASRRSFKCAERAQAYENDPPTGLSPEELQSRIDWL